LPHPDEIEDRNDEGWAYSYGVPQELLGFVKVTSFAQKCPFGYICQLMLLFSFGLSVNNMGKVLFQPPD
jgi:hypothetical protein